MLWLIVPDMFYPELIGFLVAFGLTIFAIIRFGKKLPRDQGRKFAVEGTLSEGKARGAGLIFVSVFAVLTLIFAYPERSTIFYVLFILLAMVTGYLDDASEKPWKDYKKAIFDLVTAVGITAVLISENGTEFHFGLFNTSFELPIWLYAIISVALIWLSINVTNCTDGVDGLSSVLGIITLLSFVVFDLHSTYGNGNPYMSFLFIACLLGYLLFNANPSTVLMGDAGSRAMGTMIAIAALRSGAPFMWISFALVFILDGGLGLVKLFLGRFCKIKILKNIRTPLHDHVRKNMNWSNTQTVFRFAIIQLMVSAVFLWLVWR